MEPAWSDPASRATVGRIAWFAATLLVIGLIALACFAIPAVLISSAADGLRHNGGRTAGLVIALRPNDRFQVGDATVHYTVGDSDYNGQQTLGSHALRYYVGEPVTVYYNRHRPSRFTVNGEDNQPNWLVSFKGITLFAGLFSILFASIVGLRWWRLCTVLRGCAWQPVWFELLPRMPRRNQRVLVRLAGPDGGPTGDNLTFGGRAALGGKRGEDPWQEQSWLPGRIAGPQGHWAVLTQDDSAVLMPLRRQSG